MHGKDDIRELDRRVGVPRSMEEAMEMYPEAYTEEAMMPPALRRARQEWEQRERQAADADRAWSEHLIEKSGSAARQDAEQRRVTDAFAASYNRPGRL